MGLHGEQGLGGRRMGVEGQVREYAREGSSPYSDTTDGDDRCSGSGHPDTLLATNP